MRIFNTFPVSSTIFATALITVVGGSVSTAANLTDLSAGDPSLLSQGTPADVEFNPEFDYGPNGRELGDNIANANGTTGGWTMNATFTPTAADLAAGETRLIMEIGGTSNGTGLWLIDGVPTLALKTGFAGASGDDIPSSFIANDLDITDNAAAIYSSLGRLSAGTEYTFAASWDTNDRFTVAVQDNSTQQGVLQTAKVTGTSNSYNWFGNSTFLEGNLVGATGNYGGLAGPANTPFTADDAASFEGTFNGPDTLFWNAPAVLSVSSAVDVLTLQIDLNSGNATLVNPSDTALTINGYELIGGRSGFVNDSEWNTLAQNDSGNPWTSDDPMGVQKSIGESTVTGGFTLAANGGSYNFGDIWAVSPFDDVSARIDLVGGDSVNALVEYTGTAVPFGDLDGSGMVDRGDWPVLLANLVTNVSDADPVVQYLSGDLTGDGLVNRNDFREFKSMYEAANGLGSFAAISTAVPEPGTLGLSLLCGIGLAIAKLRGRNKWWLMSSFAVFALAGSTMAADVYFVNNAGEIRSFTGITEGATPLDGQSFAAGNLEATVAAYGGYQAFTALPNGQIYGVNSTGGVDSWPSVSDWINNSGLTPLSSGVYGELVTTSPRSGIHGATFDGQTGGFYAVLEGPDANEGDLVQYTTLNDFINNENGAIYAPRGFNGNILNFYYPDEDAPASSIPTNSDAATGSNYFQVTGGGQLEGWLDLLSPGFGQYGPAATPGGSGGGGNRSYQLPNFGNDLVGGFALVEPIDELTLVVDTTTGLVSLKPATSSRTVDFLQIESPSGGLLTGDSYEGLAGAPGFPAGDGTANSMGWDLAPSNDTDEFLKAEAFAFGSSEIAPGESLIPLGHFYDTSEDVRDLILTYDHASDGTTTTVGGVYIEYVASPGLVGDYNSDGAIDAADYTVWRDSLGSDGSALPNRRADLEGTIVGAADYGVWKSGYSVNGAAGAGLAAHAVPEPSALAMLLLVFSWLAGGGRIARR